MLSRDKYKRLVGRANKVNRGPDDVLRARPVATGSTADPRLAVAQYCWII